MDVPFSVEFTGVEEQEAAVRAMQAHGLIGNGPICREVEHEIGQMFGVKHVLLTPSCTHALEMAMLTLDIAPGDEVILPSYTFVSTANSVMLRGGVPVFADIRPDTLNIDPEDIRRRITPRTRAIIPVHYAGIGCDMDEIRAIAWEHNLAVVEDAAQGVDSLYKGRYLGTIGDMGCYSFHGTKNIVCGEGGALLTNDDQLAAQARIIHEKGTNRAAFMHGLVDKYSWVAPGSSYVLSDLLAAILQVQLGKRDIIREKRAAIWQAYYNGLHPLAAQGRVILPTVPEDCEQNYHIFYFRVNSPEVRTKVLKELNARGVRAAFHYVPLHSSPFGQAQGWHNDVLPITDYCSSTLIRLPLFPAMSDDQVTYVLDQTISLLDQYAALETINFPEMFASGLKQRSI